MKSEISMELFNRFPHLVDRFGVAPIADLPTPLELLPSKEGTRAPLYLKRDDCSGRLYGGNKIRKLAFLLADAQKTGCRTVLTVGGAGSNHCAATAVYARALGLQAELFLMDQPNAAAVRKNLLIDCSCGARMHYFDDYESLSRALARRRENSGDTREYLIPAGGSSALGTIGFVNAGMELADQLHRTKNPLPRAVYCALGTMGTAVGLALGLACAGCAIPVVGVQVVPGFIANGERMKALYRETAALLNSAGKVVCAPEPAPDFVTIEERYFGGTYGAFTDASVGACVRAKREYSLSLDGTYTGKAFAAFIDRVHNDPAHSFVFYHTLNSRPPASPLPDYHLLPKPFHRYFETPLQERERLLTGSCPDDTI